MSLGESIGPFRLVEALGQGSRCSTYVAEVEGAGSSSSSPGQSKAVVIKLLREPASEEPCILDHEKARWSAATQLLPPQARLVRLAGGEVVKEEEREEAAGSSGEFKGDGQRCYLVTAPYCPGGSVEELLRSGLPSWYSVEEALRWGLDVATTLYHLHHTPGVRMPHGRVCARNVLLRDGEAWLRGPGAGLGGETAEEQKGGEEESAPAWAPASPEASAAAAGGQARVADDVHGWATVVLSLLCRSVRSEVPEKDEEVLALWRRRATAEKKEGEQQEGAEEEEQEERGAGVLAPVLQLLRGCMAARPEQRPSMRGALYRLLPLVEPRRGAAAGDEGEEEGARGGLLSRLRRRRARAGSVSSPAGAAAGPGLLSGVFRWPEEEAELVSMEERLRAKAVKGSKGMMVDEEVRATLLWSKAVLHKRLGEAESAAACLHEALRGVDQRASPLAVYCMSELAALCKAGGDADRALSLYEDALRLGRKALPSGHPDLARFMHNLSMVRRPARSDWGGEAEELTCGAAAVLVLFLLWCWWWWLFGYCVVWGQVYYGTGDFDHALTLLEEALGLKRRSLPPGDPEIATSLANIAMVHEAKGNHIRAMQMAEVALRLRRAALPPTHPHITSSLDCLAVIYCASGQYTKALPLAEEALAIRRQVLDPLDPDMARSLSNLAALYGKQQQPPAAQADRRGWVRGWRV